MNAIISGKQEQGTIKFNTVATYKGTTQKLYVSQYRTENAPFYYLKINAKYCNLQYIIPISGIMYYARNENWNMRFPTNQNSFNDGTVIYLYWDTDGGGNIFVYAGSGGIGDVIDSFEIGTLE